MYHKLATTFISPSFPQSIQLSSSKKEIVLSLIKICFVHTFYILDTFKIFLTKKTTVNFLLPDSLLFYCTLFDESYFKSSCFSLACSENEKKMSNCGNANNNKERRKGEKNLLEKKTAAAEGLKKILVYKQTICPCKCVKTLNKKIFFNLNVYLSV
jgi:hypothetical protein